MRFGYPILPLAAASGKDGAPGRVEASSLFLLSGRWKLGPGRWTLSLETPMLCPLISVSQPRLKSIAMADTLYLSLWYPNLRLAGLGDKLVQVLGEFGVHGGGSRVYAATTWPISWNESPVFQRIYGHGERGAEPRRAVEEALELLHEDYAYEFQVGWSLWEMESGSPSGDGNADPSLRSPKGDLAQDDNLGARAFQNSDLAQEDSVGASLDPRWVRQPRLVRVTGYGPLFDESVYEQEGHIRIDFGSDAAFLLEGAELNPMAARHVEENVRQLVELAGALEKASGATARLLWSELGESLAQRLAARLGAVN